MMQRLSYLHLFERSEFLIATCKKKKTDRPDVCTHNLLVLVWKNCLGSSVRSGNRKRPKHGIPLPVQIHSFWKYSHAHCDYSCGQRNGGRGCCLMHGVAHESTSVRVDWPKLDSWDRASLRVQTQTGEGVPIVKAGISPLGYWQKVNQSPTQTKPYNTCRFVFLAIKAPYRHKLL